MKKEEYISAAARELLNWPILVCHQFWGLKLSESDQI